MTVHKCFGVHCCALLHAVIAAWSVAGSVITCMSMCMHPLKNLGQHASSAVSIMLTYLMISVGSEWCPERICVRDTIK